MKKFFCIALILLLTVGIFAGCTSESKPARTESVPATTDQKMTPTETKAAETEVQSEPATTDAPVPVETDAPITTQAAETTEPATEPATTESSPVPSGESSELLKDYDWTDGVIVIDGVLYRTYDDPYSHLEENGWSFNLKDYGQDESYSLNSMEYVFSTIHLKNPEKYGDGYSSPSITIGIINTSDSLKPIKECNIHGIEVNGVNGTKTYENLATPAKCYDFELPGGVRRGSSMEDVKAAYGEPDDVYVADSDSFHYEILTYKNDEVKVTVRLTVYSDSGLQGVEISNGRQWLH